jgi:hypothetical protein
MADEKDSDLMIGPPGCQDGLGEITVDGHFESPLRFRADGYRSSVSGKGLAKRHNMARNWGIQK